MKKRLKILNGFFFGNFMLLLSYLITYLDGKDIFMAEVIKLVDIKVFLTQYFFSGITYFIIFAAIMYIKEIFNKNYEDAKWRVFTGVVIMWAMALIVSIFAYLMINNGKVNGYVGKIFFGIAIMILIYGVFGNIIYTAIKNKREKINKIKYNKKDY